MPEYVHECLSFLREVLPDVYECMGCYAIWNQVKCKACGTDFMRSGNSVSEFCSGECEYDYNHCGVKPN